jgi:hypothetical protein
MDAEESEAHGNQQGKQERMINTMMEKVWIGSHIVCNLPRSGCEEAGLEIVSSNATPFGQEKTMPAIYCTTVVDRMGPTPGRLRDSVATEHCGKYQDKDENQVS